MSVVHAQATVLKVIVKLADQSTTVYQLYDDYQQPACQCILDIITFDVLLASMQYEQ